MLELKTKMVVFQISILKIEGVVIEDFWNIPYVRGQNLLVTPPKNL